MLAQTVANFEYGEGALDIYETHQIVQCQGCLSVSFREVLESSDDVQYDERTGEVFSTAAVKLFPSRVVGRQEMDDAHLLPHGVYRIYHETHAALCGELPIMAGFGLRAIVEAVCKDQRIDARNLEDRIDKLASAGLITVAGAKILHSLRFMGNTAVHEMKAHSQKEINIAFNIIEHLLQGVYILPKHAEGLPRHGL